MNAAFSKHSDYPVKWIPVGNLGIVWPDAQRPYNRRKVDEIKAEFDDEAFGVLIVTLPNGEGIYHIVDGDNRAQAVREMWGDEQKVPCLVLSARTKADAARVWSKINGNRTKPQATQQFIVDVTAGLEPQVSVNKIIRHFGYRIGRAWGDQSFAAVRAAVAVYTKLGEEALIWTFRTIQEAWGMNQEAVNGGFIQAFADLFVKYPTVDRDRLIEKVAKLTTPGRLLGEGRSAKDFLRVRLPEALLYVLVQAYNHNLRTGPRLGDKEIANEQPGDRIRAKRQFEFRTRRDANR